jgi:hypothetical protein
MEIDRESGEQRQDHQRLANHFVPFHRARWRVMFEEGQSSA